MLTTKRVVIATICGVIFGFVCLMLASSNPNPLPNMAKWQIVLGRTMLGFVIGISALRLNWWLHGIVLGFILSIPMAIPVLNDMKIAVGTMVMGMIYGFLTELIATIIFKAKAAGK
jgi:K+-transporting ATPase c subunit